MQKEKPEVPAVTKWYYPLPYLPKYHKWVFSPKSSSENWVDVL